MTQLGLLEYKLADMQIVLGTELSSRLGVLLTYTCHGLE